MLSVLDKISSSKSNPNCLSSLMPHLNTNWEQYILYYYKTREAINYQLRPDPSMLARFVSLDNDTIPLLLARGAYRYSNPYNIVIRPIVYGKPWESVRVPIYQFAEVLVPSRSMFLYIWAKTRPFIPNINDMLAKWHPELVVFSALKLILTIPSNFECKPSQTSVTPICSGYCSTTQAEIQLSQLEQQFHQNSLHRHLFYNGHERRIHGVVTDLYGFIRQTAVNQQNVCLSRNTRLKDKCRTDIMSMLAFIKTHNLTAVFHKMNPETQLKLNLGSYISGPDAISSATFFPDYSHVPLSSIVHLNFDTYDSKVVQYCPRLIHENDTFHPEFQVWHEPFTFEIWMSVLPVIGFAMLHSLRLYGKGIYAILCELVSYFATVFGESVKPRYFIISYCVGFLLEQIYSNGLTSIVTVALAPVGFKSINEFIDNQYKIIFASEMNTMSVEHKYGEDFKSLGLKTEQAFHIMKNVTYTEDILRKMVEKDKHFGMLQDTSLAKYFQAYASVYLKNIVGVACICFTIDQPLSRAQYFWIMKTENQYWLKGTLAQLFASGLYFKWDEWSLWHNMVRNNLLNTNYSPGSDTIEINKFSAMFFIWVIFMIVCLSVFLLERFVCKHSINESERDVANFRTQRQNILIITPCKTLK
ncbi:unnamed protein product [Orchesella dallaii]|uniref:Uncharacterized protein n=1 Tax=Orchesella dallaii TaxID=48710 RepID=A0ABP1PQG7_9HEXA